MLKSCGIMLQKFLTLVILVSIVLLTMLAGWGLAALPAFFSNPARTGLVAVMIFAALCAFLLDIDLNPFRKGHSALGQQSWVLLALTLASLFLMWFLPYADRRQICTFGDSFILRWLGLSLCAAGIAVRLLALAKLGKQFSAYVTLQDGHELVQSGIYGVIRHPLYLSLLLMGPGFALVFRSELTVPILLAAVAFVSVRIRQEEKLLESQFAASFARYRARTWMLVPMIL